MSEISKPCPTCHNEMKDMGCGHSPYWRTISDGCMACRATKAESELTASRKRVEELSEALALANKTLIRIRAGRADVTEVIHTLSHTEAALEAVKGKEE